MCLDRAVLGSAVLDLAVLSSLVRSPALWSPTRALGIRCLGEFAEGALAQSRVTGQPGERKPELRMLCVTPNRYAVSHVVNVQVRYLV